MTETRCRFCLSSDIYRLSDARRRYWRCRTCGGISAAAECFLDSKAQRTRYLLHRNTLDSAGYEAFLRRFIEPVASFMQSAGLPVRRVFDYGCGPEPALIELMRRSIFPGADIRGWDPFFFPECVPFDGGADLVVCLEVAEHFEDVDSSFAGLCRLCRPGGIAAVGTMEVPADDGAFLSWWYKEDCTHVSFYSRKAISAAARRAGLVPCGESALQSDRLFLFARERAEHGV